MDFQTFYEGKLGPQELSCLASFVKNHHTITVWSYHPEDLPPFVAGRDAREILPAEMIFSEHDPSHKGTFGSFADLFRWELLKQKGGIWVDTDVFCISPDWPDADVFYGWQDEHLINVAVMKFPKEHPLVVEAAEIARKTGPNCQWGELGPVLLTNLVKKHNLARFALEENVFYPARLWWALNLREEVTGPEKINEFRKNGAVCIHLWNEGLRSVGVDKNTLPVKNSTLWTALKEYNLSPLYKSYAIEKKIREINNLIEE